MKVFDLYLIEDFLLEGTLWLSLVFLVAFALLGTSQRRDVC